MVLFNPVGHIIRTVHELEADNLYWIIIQCKPLQRELTVTKTFNIRHYTMPRETALANVNRVTC